MAINFTETGIVKNWGPFFDIITEAWAEIDTKRKAERDPYKQLLLDEQKKTLSQLRSSYENFLNSINTYSYENLDDIGNYWLRELENYTELTTKEAHMQTKDYMHAVYRAKLRSIKQIVEKFKIFIPQH